MKLLEEYQELIERDSIEISFLWKAVQTFLYFLSAATGYACSILFYTLWDIFGGNCPLWATMQLLTKITVESDHTHDEYRDAELVERSDQRNWRKYILNDHEYENKCKMYFVTSLSSCIFAVIWLTLFFMCGKGGYNIGIYDAPWRIVFPALFFNFIFTIITIYTTHDMENGYVQFSRDIKQLFLELPDIYKSGIGVSECEIIQSYVEPYNLRNNDACNTFLWLQMLSWTMMWSWIIGLIVLIFRVVKVNDFNLLKVKIYEVPCNSVTTSPDNVHTNLVEKTIEHHKEKKD